MLFYKLPHLFFIIKYIHVWTLLTNPFTYNTYNLNLAQYL